MARPTRLQSILDGVDAKPRPKQDTSTLTVNVGKLLSYLQLNERYLVPYAAWYRAGLPISSATAESAVNELVSMRMAKRRQMRWSEQGAHSPCPGSCGSSQRNAATPSEARAMVWQSWKRQVLRRQRVGDGGCIVQDLPHICTLSFWNIFSAPHASCFPFGAEGPGGPLWSHLVSSRNACMFGRIRNHVHGCRGS